MFCGPLEHQTTIAQWPKMADSRDSVRWRIPGLFRPGAIPETGVPPAHLRDYSGTIPGLFRGYSGGYSGNRGPAGPPPRLFRDYSGAIPGAIPETRVRIPVGNLIASPE